MMSIFGQEIPALGLLLCASPMMAHTKGYARYMAIEMILTPPLSALSA